MAFLAIVGVTILTAEGLLSLLTGQSLVRRLPRVFEADLGFDRITPSAPTDAEMEEIAKGNPGPYWLHPDPRVGLSLRPSSEMILARATVRTGPIGLRQTPAPPASEASRGEQKRIAVVGASIPFGLGVADDETLAARLQELFAHKPTAGTAVVGATVAAPLWSYRNATRFLLDHWAELEPDIVLYMPFPNDLGDTQIVNAAGYRTAWSDAFNPQPWPPIDRRKDLIWKRLIWGIRQARLSLSEDALGSHAIEADLSPESSRRYDENADALARLARHCEARGARLALLIYRRSAHGWHLLSRLRERGLEIPTVPFFERIHADFKLGWDPHPNPRTQEVMALWTAQELVRLGWLETPSQPWPEVPELYARHRAGPWSAEQIHRRSAEARRQALEMTTSSLDFETGEGMKQVYGGLTWEGSAGTGLLAMLRRGREVEVELEALDGLDIYPLEIAVEIDGEEVGTLLLHGGGPHSQRFPVPEPTSSTQVMEVRLLPADWGVAVERQVLEAVSFRPLRILAH